MLDEITRETAATRITAFADEGRLVQSKWHGTDLHGREIACLLGAIHPHIKSARDCPADIMPLWLAHMLPTLFDRVHEMEVSEYGRRFALALRYGNTDESVLRKVLITSIGYTISEAAKMQPNPAPKYWAGVKSSCERVTVLLNKGGSEGEFDDAASAATDAAAYASRIAYDNAAIENIGSAACAAANAARVARFAAYAVSASRAAYAAYAACGVANVAEAAAYAASDAVDTAGSISADAYSAIDAGYEHIFDVLINAMLDGVTVPVEVAP